MVAEMAVESSFGRRRVIPETSRHLMVVPSDNVERTVIANDEKHLAIKEQIRSILMSRIDPAVAAELKRPQLLSEIRLLVSDIADRTRVRLNEREEAILV